MIHKLAHFFGLYHGHVYSWWDEDILMIGFRCSKCGDISGVHPATRFVQRSLVNLIFKLNDEKEIKK